ncbi:MAG: hypothetical protein D6733_06790 [Methanobacteriota archaeon]|nr:MAG: hypothetical protein D6733_06790 [Euryarchaeota archaeon]
MGRWQALEIVEPCIDETKKLLFPIRRGYWLKLALVTLLGGIGTGGAFGFGNPFQSLGNPRFQEDPELAALVERLGDFLAQNTGVILIAMGLLFLFILFLSYLHSVMQFVFFQDVVEGGVELLGDIRRHLGRGLSLFVFGLVLWVAMLLFMALGALPLLLIVSVDAGPFATIMGMMSMMIFTVAVVLLSALAYLLAVDFAVPIMFFKGKGIWASYSEVLRLIKKDVWQFVVYIILRVVLGIAGGILYMLITIPVMVLWALVIGVLGIVALAGAGSLGITLGGIGPLGWILILTVLFLILILFSYTVKVLTLPIPVYLRLYSFTFLMTQDKALTAGK